MPARDPHSYSNLDQARLQHIDLSFHVDFKSQTMSGRGVYRLDRARRGPFDLDIRGLDVLAVRDGRESLPWKTGPEDPLFGQPLTIQDLGGRNSFEIEFRTRPSAFALQWLTPEQSGGGNHPYLFTQCQPIHARTVFPCQDSPSVRFTYSAEIVVPADLTAVMAAASRGSEAHPNGRVFRFQMPQPVPSYLFAMAVGDLTFRELGPRTGVYADPGLADAAAWEFAQTEAMMAEAEGLFGPYDWERYDLLVMPASFPYGGMENPRLTFLTPTILAGNRALVNLIAHELAHSWTGNLVTNATWEDFWLNEGWTTYAERRIIEALEGPDGANLRAQTGRNSMFRAMRRFGMDSDPTRLKFSQKGIDPESVVSYVPYEKGFSLLVRLEREAGRAAFDRFTREYIGDHRFQSITTEAFVEYLQRKLPAAARKVNLKRWLYEPGFPDDAPDFPSRLAQAVSERLFDYQEGRLPKAKDVAGWTTAQMYLFLQSLPRKIPVGDCAAFDSVLDMSNSRIAVNLSNFYEISIRSGYREILPRVESLISTVGRTFVLLPVVTALAETEWSRPTARGLIERYRERHHPITVSMMDGILQRAGL
ncbi:MAG TPA: leukotriene A4 hydrolase C-terminal domain-containing protein [Anaerolineales bacterium]|nr:leukotriene A4 hydrolase C-terminal domain-containing protein [Anaerolineales bacterium]